MPISISTKLFVMAHKNNGLVWLYCSTTRQLMVTGTTVTESQWKHKNIQQHSVDCTKPNIMIRGELYS